MSSGDSSIGPKISIVITCYNYARYVGEAIDSALAQTYPHKEVIVVDDGSTDGSADVIARYGDRVRFMPQHNRGQVAATNNGYAAAGGDIVLFLDADDRLLPNALQEVARAWRTDCVKVQFDLAVIDGAGEDLGRRFCNFLPDYEVQSVRKDFTARGTYLSPVLSGNAYSRRYLEGMMPLTVTSAPDGILNTVAPVYGDVVTIARVLGCYRLHGGNLDHQGAGGAADPERFAKSIARRYGEIAVLREHAVRRNVTLPPGNLLDSDLVFINYRLMLKKLGVSYMGAEADTPGGLWQHAMRVVGAMSSSPGAKAAHILWFSALAVAPRGLARMLVTLRFNRAAYIQPVRRRMPFGRSANL